LEKRVKAEKRNTKARLKSGKSQPKIKEKPSPKIKEEPG
jgi:hypothetical protein